MISRDADSLYWMSRYLERAEHTARLLDVNLNLMLDQSPTSGQKRWERLFSSLGVKPPAITHDAYSVTQALTFDVLNPASVVSCVAAARENARQTREQVSSEMWEQVNRLFLHVRQTKLNELWNAQPSDFFRAVKQGAHLFQGITDSTIGHGEGWHFIQLGRCIERAGATARLLDVHFGGLLDGRASGSEVGDHLEWIGLLKSCTGFEAYCKEYTADLRPERIAEFLLLNPEFPRSVRFAADSIETALRGISLLTQRKAERLDRLAGRLRSTLSYGQIDEILASGLHVYLETIQSLCVQIHGAVYQIYITYPIESVLTV